MSKRELLPHLSAAALAALDPFAEKPTDVPPGLRAEVAGRARVAQNTVDRFLRGETYPRSADLDKMVTAIADVAQVDWLDPWRDAITRAEKAAADLQRDLGPRREPGTSAAEELLREQLAEEIADEILDEDQDQRETG